ncbi:MAG: hypothetical protein HZC22_01605 [Rhodocyclales bacterium]|nr:hypothetical protein [Rhodocyclales bacterium]
MKRPAALVFAALLLPLPAAPADDPAAPPTADDPVAMRAVAARLRDEAADVRRVAAEEHTRAQQECWKTFLVSRCLDQAAQAHRDGKLKAANLESRSRAIERELKRREVVERQTKRAERKAAQGNSQ